MKDRRHTWTDEETALLLSMRQSDAMFKVIGALVGRSAWAAAGRYRHLTKPKRVRIPRALKKAPTTWNERALTERWCDRKRRQQSIIP